LNTSDAKYWVFRTIEDFGAAKVKKKTFVAYWAMWATR
jgi:hypothetical protein